VAEAFRAVWKNPYVRAATGLLLAFFALWFLAATWRVGRLVLAAGLLAALVHPLKRRLIGLGLPPALAYALVGVAAVLAMALFWAGLFAVVGQLLGSLKALPEDLAAGVRALAGFWDRLVAAAPAWAQTALSDVPRELSADFWSVLSEALFALEVWLKTGLVPALVALLGSAIDVVVGFFLFLYFLWDGKGMLASLLRLAPASVRPALLWLGEAVEAAVLGYFRGQVIVAASMGFLVGLGLYLLGLPMPAAVGFLVAVFELIPMLGVTIGAGLTLLAALGQGLGTVLLALLLFTLVAELEGHVLGPLIMARTTQLHPLTVLLALIAGAELGGLGGALVAVPLAAFLKHVFLELVAVRTGREDLVDRP